MFLRYPENIFSDSGNVSKHLNAGRADAQSLTQDGIIAPSTSGNMCKTDHLPDAETDKAPHGSTPSPSDEVPRQTLPNDVKLPAVFPSLTGLARELDEAQVAAVTRALNEPLTVIKGPTGTGKTFVGAVIVREWLRVDESSKVR